jgi:hypothetical protein
VLTASDTMSALATRTLNRIHVYYLRQFRQRGVHDRNMGVSTNSGSSACAPALTGQEVPLSYAQETMLFWDRLVPRSAVYNVPFAMSIEGALDVEALKKSIELIISRHLVLHTNFVFVRGEPAQVAGSPERAAFSILDFSSLPAAEKVSTVKQTISAEARRPFDLSKDLMLRALLLRLAQTEHVLLVTLHHIASDGWSIGVFLQELSQAYLAFSSGKPHDLQPLPMQYADFAKWQRELLQGPVLGRSLSFWKQQLEGVPEFTETIPLRQPRPAQQTFAGGTLRTLLPSSFVPAIAELGQTRRATVFMVMLAAFQALLERYSGKDDISLGVPVANRARPEFANLIGCFINMVVVRSNLSGNPSFLEVLGRVRETSLAAFFHPELPFSELVRHLRPKRSTSHTPFFQVQLVFQNFPVPTIQWPGLTLTRFEVETDTSKFDLSVLIEQKEGLEIAFEYNTALFEQATMQRMLDEYRFLLESVVKHPETRLHDLPLGALVG